MSHWSESHIKNFSNKGIIHVGGHLGEEAELYARLRKRVLWIEPIPEVFNKLVGKISSFPNQEAKCALIFDSEKEVIFNIAEQTYRSSLYYFTDWHFNDPKFSIRRQVPYKTTRLDSFDLEGFDCLIIDAQGADYNVIKSLGDQISNFNLVIAEVMKVFMYEGISLEKDIDEYMSSSGFRLVSNMKYEDERWRNNAYVRNH